MDAPSTRIRPVHLGLSRDGQSCRIVFADEKQNMFEYTASFGDFGSLISALSEAASEMARRQSGTHTEQRIAAGAMEISSAAFQLHPTDGSIMGALVSEAGDVVGLRMRPEVACQLSRDLLLAAPAVYAS